MITVFSKSDFTLCEVPVPDGYKQSQTHCGIAYYDGNFFLTTSPYPSNPISLWKVYLMAGIRKVTGGRFCKPFIAELWENPCLYIGEKENNKIPIKFKLLQGSPLMPPPVPYYGYSAYNSDPDLYIEGGFIHVLNRVVFRMGKNDDSGKYDYVTRLYHIYGTNDEGRFKFLVSELLHESDRNLISPCLTYYHGEYILMELETYSYNDGSSFQGLYLTRSSSLDGYKKNVRWEPVIVDFGQYLPWHMSVFQNDGHLYSIVSCVKRGESKRCWQMFGEFSDDLKTLHIYQTPLTDLMSYRSSALVHEGQFILYNSVVHERIKGSKSVDGRDILLANMSFDCMLQILLKNG